MIYMYTLHDNVNRAMTIIHKSIIHTLKKLQAQTEYYEELLTAFEEKQKYVKDKYPKGTF